MEDYKFDKNWILGFIGIIGLYKLPLVLNYFQGTASKWELTNLLWLLWFLYFIPENKTSEA